MNFIQSTKCKLLQRRLLFLSLLAFSFITLCGGSAVAQNESGTLKVVGIVKDNTGYSLPGVAILVKGTTVGTTTNVDGHYTLSDVPANATLVFLLLG